MCELAVAMRVSPRDLQHLDADELVTLIEVLNERNSGGKK